MPLPATENTWPANQEIRRCIWRRHVAETPKERNASPKRTCWYYLRRPRIHLGWIHTVITHCEKKACRIGLSEFCPKCLFGRWTDQKVSRFIIRTDVAIYPRSGHLCHTPHFVVKLSLTYKTWFPIVQPWISNVLSRKYTNSIILISNMSWK